MPIRRPMAWSHQHETYTRGNLLIQRPSGHLGDTLHSTTMEFVCQVSWHNSDWLEFLAVVPLPGLLLTWEKPSWWWKMDTKEIAAAYWPTQLAASHRLCCTQRWMLSVIGWQQLLVRISWRCLWWSICHSEIFLSPEFGTMFQREVRLFLEEPEYCYNSVG